MLKKIAAKILPKKIVHDIRYRRCHKRKMDWKNPKSLDEKLHWSMVYNIDKNEAKYADKIEVRKYIKECGLGDLLIPTLLDAVYENANEIPFEKLPNQFVVVANHGSGSHFIEICRDKNKVNWNDIVTKMNKALTIDFSLDCNEYQYKYIKRKLIIEKYLNDNNKDLIDYKFLCFDGEPSLVQLISDRSEGMKINYYNMDWQFVDCGKDFPYSKEITCPISFETMVKACKVIGKGMPFARIDFYEVNGKPYFGEITLTPAGGYMHYLKDDVLLELGNKFVLRKKGEKFVIK